MINLFFSRVEKDFSGKEFICGNRFSLADIMFYCFLNFGTTVGQPLNEDNKNVVNLYNKIHTRPSASA